MCCSGKSSNAVQRLAHGVAGLAKVAAQQVGVPIDRADQRIIQKRLDVCRGCEYATRSEHPAFAANKGLTTLSRCQECGCLITAKVRLRSESCPLGKWKSE